MALINLSIQHGRSLEEARQSLETAVDDIHRRFRVLVRQVVWSADRNRVRLDGTGFWVDMWADAQMVYVTGDLLGLSGLLTGSVATGLQEVITQALQKRLP